MKTKKIKKIDIIIIFLVMILIGLFAYEYIMFGWRMVVAIALSVILMVAVTIISYKMIENI